MLRWGDIERAPWRIVKRQEKTDERVYIPLSETARGLIDDKALHDCGEAVFPALAASRQGYHSRLDKWAKDAGISKRVGWHTGRHTFAVMLLEGGADVYTVSKLLGHTDIKTTQVYAKVTDKLKSAAVEALPKIEIGG